MPSTGPDKQKTRKEEIPLCTVDESDSSVYRIERINRIGMDLLKTFRLTIGNIRLDEKSQSEKKQIVKKLSDLFRNNTIIKDAEINIQLKLGHYPVKQETKSKTNPLHLQEAVGNEIEKLTKSELLETSKTSI